MADLSASLIEASAIEVNNENIKEISDDTLFKKLRVLNLNPGPITPTTRGLYERKLLNYLAGNQSAVSPSESMLVEERIESIRHAGSPFEAKASAAPAVASLNDSFDSYSRQISSIRSRAPLHQQENAKSNFFFSFLF
jgi:hypothetical protein